MVAFNAEIWSPTVQQAAPAEPPPEPPQAQPPAKPEPPAPTPPPSAREMAQQREAEIALEKRRQQAERKKLEEAKALKDKQAKEQAERDRREREKARKEEERRDAALRDEMRKEQVRRVQQQAKASTPQAAVGTGTAESKGTAAQSAAPSSSYAGRIVQQIRDNTKYSNPETDQPSVLIMVKTAPNGDIRETRVITSSGNRLFDEAVLRGIKKMGSVPRDIDGKIPEVLLREGLEIRVAL
jgi:colicin import membrane protein